MGRKLGACHYTVREEIGKVVESKRGKRKVARPSFLLLGKRVCYTVKRTAETAVWEKGKEVGYDEECGKNTKQKAKRS